MINTIETRFLRLGRLEGLTDGVFAIAMTILVFGLQLPDNLPDSALTILLETHILEKLFIYVGSFIILGTQWIGLSYQHSFLTHINRPYLWLNIFTLMVICIVPFSASLIVDHTNRPISIYFYTGNLLCISLGQLMIFYFAEYFQLNHEQFLPAARKIIKRRIMVPSIFYVLAIIIAQWNTYAAFFALIIPPFIHITRSRADIIPIDIDNDNNSKKGH